MSYFKNHEFIIGYRLQGQDHNIMNITKRIRLAEEIKNDTNLFFYYTMKESDTPIMMADRLYDDVNLHWVFMAFNDRYDIYNDWPLDGVSLNEFIDRKYEGNVYATHHYESIATGAIVDSFHPSYDKIAITNYDYEIKINDSKRKIKVVKPEYVGLIRKLAQT